MIDVETNPVLTAPVRIRFRVTQEHIDAGTRLESGSCPISLALQELGFSAAFVSPEDVYLRAYGDGHEWQLNEAARSFVCDFDDGDPVEPFVGEISR